MNRILEKQKRLTRRVVRVRHAIKPKHPKPRLVVNKTNKYFHVQIIDDIKGVTLCAASSNEKSFAKKGNNKESAKALGQLIAQRAKEKKVTQVVLDRRGRIYQGSIGAFADAARESGLEF
jgi:large subunit ribosomal protein L18